MKTVALAAICVAFAGCMTVALESDSAVPVMMPGAPEQDFTVVRPFETSHQGWFTLYDLVTINNPGIQKTLDAELKRSDGDAIINLKIVEQTTAIDGLVPIGISLAGYALGVTLAPDVYTGIAYGSAIGSIAAAMLSSRTYTISGDVIRYKD
jgi:hypothetical protein